MRERSAREGKKSGQRCDAGIGGRVARREETSLGTSSLVCRGRTSAETEHAAARRARIGVVSMVGEG